MDRLFQAQDYAEYCAALTASAIYNVYRKANTPFLTPDQFMWRHLTRTGAKTAGTAEPMRFARPGERPPSMLRPGVRDGVIERFDRFATRLHQGGGRIN